MMPCPEFSSPPPVYLGIAFRMRFTDFKGKYVLHCHALHHKDKGMQLALVIQCRTRLRRSR